MILSQYKGGPVFDGASGGIKLRFFFLKKFIIEIFFTWTILEGILGDDNIVAIRSQITKAK